MADETGGHCTPVISEAPLSCGTCAQIINFCNTGTDRDMISLGSISSLIETECPHGEWIKHFRSIGFKRPNTFKIQDFSECTMHVMKANSSIQLRCSRNKVGYPGSRSELVHRKNTGGRHPGRARILDPSWIDEEVILNWKDLCNEHHGGACEHPGELQRLDAVQPTWLIDTTDACLVPGRGKMRYIALSYIRGQTASLYNEKSIIDQLQRPGVLVAGALAEKVPRTVRNAIDVVRLLGERYLWVDSLCIVQDDVETMQVELDSMARIYSTSYLTIVAADGTDASYGLRGLRGLTPQRDIKQEIIPLAPPENLIVPTTRNLATHRAYYSREWNQVPQRAYYSRAWTYQEYLCAKRRLIFQNETVYWECNRSFWREELIPDLLPLEKRTMEPWEYPDLFTTSSFPDLKSMNIHIEEFNQKILTFPDDALLAFSGIQWVLSQTFLGGVLYGIPELFFEIGLMWNPIGMIQRRHSTRKSQWDSRLPSWSFLGWQGSAKFKFECEFDVCWSLWDENVIGVERPVTTWYTIDHPGSSKKRQIESNWYKYKSLAQDTTQEPLEGWMRQKFGSRFSTHGNTLSYSGDGQEYGYTHSKSPEIYRYPVPVLDATKQHPLQPQTQFLSCKTSRAFIHGVPRILREGGGSSSLSELGDGNSFKKARLQDPDGNAVGFITLMREVDREVFAEKTAPGTLVELVAISEGWFGGYKSGEEEKETKNWTAAGFPRRECYHVLWVEWEEGTAYRRGNGCVLKEAWEKLREKELVDLILG